MSHERERERLVAGSAIGESAWTPRGLLRHQNLLCCTKFPAAAKGDPWKMVIPPLKKICSDKTL